MATDAETGTRSGSELIRWAFGRFDAHDIEGMRSIWTAETVQRFPDRTCVGAEEIAAYFEALIAAVPDLRVEILAMGSDGDDVLVRWRIRGTHEGRVQGVAGTGRSLEVHGIDHFVVRDGKIVSNFVVTDRLDFAQQAGMLPRDGTLADRAGKGAFNALGSLRRRLRR